LGLFFAAFLFIPGKVFAEPAASSSEASAEASQAFDANIKNSSDNENLSEDTLPAQEEIDDDEVVDSDA